MSSKRSKLATGLATLLVAALSGGEVWELSLTLDGEAGRWLERAVDLLLLVGIHRLEERVAGSGERALAPESALPGRTAKTPQSGTTNVS